MNRQPKIKTKTWQGSHWIRPEKRRAIYARYNHRCVYCGAEAGDGVRLTLDHITPRCLGGGNETENLVTACLSCNSARQDRPVLDFARSLADQGVNPLAVAQRVKNAVRRQIGRAK